jgi:hypothetical protein
MRYISKAKKEKHHNYGKHNLTAKAAKILSVPKLAAPLRTKVESGVPVISFQNLFVNLQKRN